MSNKMRIPFSQSRRMIRRRRNSRIRCHSRERALILLRQRKKKVDDSSMSTMQEMSEDIYIVEKGDTLAKISKKVYGDSGHVDAICRMNGLSDGNLIFIGQKLILP